MAPPPEKPEPTKSKPEATPIPPPPREKRQTLHLSENEFFGFMDAIIELKKFFTDYPTLLELDRQLKNAQGTERIDIFYRHLMSLD
ncbi:hypothetical protein TNCV_2906911 [Trichonephila clavipes]|nr:hypothetical protein TNCV_2906911 [Trichonephila clavipes]